MNKFFLYLLIVLCCNVSFSQVKDTVYGKVKSVREEVVFLNKNRQNYRLFDTDGDYGHMGFVSNKATKERFYSNWYHTAVVHYLNYYKEFDEKGRPTNEIWYYKNGDIVRSYKYKYNDKGQLIQESEIRLDDDYVITNKSYDYSGKLKSAIRYYKNDPESFSYVYYIYDDSLKLIESNGFSNEGAVSGVKFSYDVKGNKTKKLIHDYWFTEYHGDGSSSSWQKDYGNDKLKEEYFYDEDSNLVEIKYYRKKYKDENQVELGSKTKNYYFKNGLLRYGITTSEHDTLTNLIIYKYDKNGRKIEQVHVHKRFVKNTDDIIFNTKNININDVKLPNDELMVGRMLKYKYDQNNIIELKETEAFGKTVTKTCKFEYVFDDQKNWIEQTKYVNGEKLYVWKRKIKYFE